MNQPTHPSQTASSASLTEAKASTAATPIDLPQRRKARVHLIVGPVGAGKSTYALQLAQQHNAVRLNLDDWIAELFSQDRPHEDTMAWYIERTRRCLRQIWKISQSLIGVGTDVVLEIGLIQRHEREAFCAQIDEQAIDLTLYVLDAPRDIRRQRVQQRNAEKGATFSMVVPAEIFELASDLWQPPMAADCAGRDVRFVELE
ncbi:AAA family ATPase [Dyella silvatica]|uniref:AAA family ATPase n=1 Tax=Dyella silvatica TaxID=2992128 RepID=UPI002251A6CB|nr:ATP-binding protein [Dyella silvatica]